MPLSIISISGSSVEISALEQRYVAGEWTPFGVHKHEKNTGACESKSEVTEQMGGIIKGSNSVPGEPGAFPTNKSEGKERIEKKGTNSGKYTEHGTRKRFGLKTKTFLYG